MTFSLQRHKLAKSRLRKCVCGVGFREVFDNRIPAGRKERPMAESLGSILASFIPTTHTTPVRCPKCGGRLTTTVAIYATVPVDLKLTQQGGEVIERKTLYGRRIVETKAALNDQLCENYGVTDERDELHCESPDCDYWTRPVEIEFPQTGEAQPEG